MSGMEVIGLALALWPVVGLLNELYSSVKDGSASRWAMTIKVQERIFKECVLKLLQGDEDLSEKDRIGLITGDKSFTSLWQDAEFSARLESRLDKELCMLIKHEVLEISKLVSNLQRYLGEIKTEPAAKRVLPSFRDVKRVLRKDEIKKNLDYLAFHNSALRKLLKTCSSTAYADAKPAANTVQRQSTLQEERQKRIDAQFFNGFHEVLGKSFRCNCPAGHEANLSVTDTMVMFQSSDLSRVMSNLRLRGRSATMESDMTAYEDADDGEDMMSEWIRSTWSRARQGSLSMRPGDNPALLVKYSESRGVQNFTPIPDLCQWIHTVRMSPPNSPKMRTEELQGVLGAHDGKRYTVRAPRQHTALTIVSMEEWLATCGTASKRRRVRAELAMNLAATILQFYPTAWIEKTWTWQNFSVARHELSHDLMITQRFWSLDMPRRQSLKKTPAAAPSKFWSTFQDLDPMLVRLGFGLIELALGKRLADIRMDKDTLADGGGSGGDSGSSDADLADYYTAVDVLNSNEIEDEIGVTYQRVVEACLRCRVISDVGIKLLKSNSSKFESDLERFVVEPLRRHHSSIWGTAQVTTY
ncbi:uncharacterized protein SPSK_10294 [Sporothrix schenckii 1099-18]|uniref:DUF7580 domain-containing protein n=1 Tax=Sporothrix schenckii 1099-18 TaxID=1397361 RepID=A0A0F2M5I6_SPOSC|nr:uncharacterized protein SPSK_10294 [Sporothrix schenckii 1099-18]KJR84055.1 hypothetical protein SPSK_10294 [Sporothrix schenckii 1099-18]